MSQSNIFTIQARDPHSKARAGVVQLPRGQIHTPNFMPIGTTGSVKSLTNQDLEVLNAEIILGNTYHLWLRPGMQTMQNAGGLHKFIHWQKPILTDSGGFQAFSLGKNVKFTEEGVTFRSHLNGEKKLLTPEISMQIQSTIGSDIALVLDEVLPAEVNRNTALKAMKRTYRWAKRSQEEFEKIRTISGHNNVLFGIPQGAQFVDLRVESAKLTMELDFPGYSIGGVANGGEPEEMMYAQVLAQTEILEDHKPRHLLGVGTPKDIIEMVKRGIDLFDCVYPTRNARHGSIFAWTDEDKMEYETLKIAGTRFINDFNPINSKSKFPELREYSKAYLCHLFRAKELLAYRLATLHNLEFYLDLMKKIRFNIYK